MAQAFGAANICVIGLNKTDGKTVSLDDRAKLTGKDCAVYSNSTDADGLASVSAAAIDTAFNCTSGGYKGQPQNFKPVPLIDCPPREDPVKGRIEPATGPCDHHDYSLKDYSGTIYPGVYCGGLKIDGASKVKFEPGIYVIKDGALLLKGTSAVSGAGVGVFFAGDNAEAFFEDDVTVDFSAPAHGAMSGLLFWQSGLSTGSNMFEIKSNFVDRLVGTIYLPRGHLYVGATDDVAEASEYTIIVADKVDLRNNSQLVLNANYSMSAVPVPRGLGNTGGNVFLRE